ncbi:MAG: nuclease, partial [Actinobacteria bacterium]|nr:nuclease [Actinomycetota bacterium]
MVIDTIDGDTLRADIAGVRETIRLIGVDTPETKHPTKRAQCYGPEATQFLAALLPPGTRVRIERDAEARDPYGRLLLYLFIAR